MKREGRDVKETFKTFWRNLLEKLNNKINQWLNKGEQSSGEMTATDTTKINFFIMVLKSVLNRVLMDCSFDIVSESGQAEPLKKAVKNLKENAYKIGGYMLGGSETPDCKSECWAILIDKACGIHHFMSGNEICITEKSGDHIKDCYMIWNAVKRNNKVYLLCRQHTLDDNGTLTIRFFIADETAQEVNANIPEWNNFLYEFGENGVRESKKIIIPNANHIGFGRYKSPVLCLTNDTYGKPLNFGCGKIEREIQNTLDMIRLEYKATKTKLFPDWSIVKDTDKYGNPLNAYVMDEYIYPTQAKAGLNDNRRSLIDYFSPEIRHSAYFELLVLQLEQYQALMGVQDLITHEKTTANATATEIRSNNINNMALEKSIRATYAKGNEDTLKADGLYYGIRDDLWSYDETWQDLYENEQQTLQNNITMTESGGQSQRDLVKYWFPTFTDEQIDEKIAEINAEKENSTNKSIEDMLNV